jgi:hypothetical protein
MKIVLSLSQFNENENNLNQILDLSHQFFSFTQNFTSMERIMAAILILASQKLHISFVNLNIFAHPWIYSFSFTQRKTIYETAKKFHNSNVQHSFTEPTQVDLI